MSKAPGSVPDARGPAPLCSVETMKAREFLNLALGCIEDAERFIDDAEKLGTLDARTKVTLAIVRGGLKAAGDALVEVADSAEVQA